MDSKKRPIKINKRRKNQKSQAQKRNAPGNRRKGETNTQQNPLLINSPQSHQTTESEVNPPQSGESSEPCKSTIKWSRLSSR